MKFTCEKNQLSSAIVTASRATASKSPVPLLEGLLIEAEDENVRITGYDLKTGIVTTIPAEVGETGGIVLNARLFGDIIRKAPGLYVTISVNPRMMATITSEMSEFEILGSPAPDYPELPPVEGQDGVEIGEATLKKMINQTNFAVSDNESRPIHTGSLFEAEGGVLTIVAVDGYRLALCRQPIDSGNAIPLSFVVPGAALGEVEKIASDDEESKIQITLGSKHIQFIIGDTVLISRRLEGEFLNYKNSIPQSSKYRLTVDKNEIIAAVERVSLILNEKIKVKSPVKCVFSDRIIKLSTASALGKAIDECVMEGDGEELEVGFNDRYLIEALKAAPTNELTVELTSGVTPCIITPADDSEDFLYMILPVRLKTYEG